MSGLRESATWFGPGQSLFGIVTPTAAAAPRLGAVLMNPGTLHRVGGARLNVRLARRLAAQGVPAIRFDFSGLGDSESRQDGLPYVASMVADLRAAMDALTAATGVERFALVGHCTGAAMSYEAALVDQRVRGVVQLEGFAYRTSLYQLHRWRRIALRRENWSALLRGEKSLRSPLLRVGRGLLRRVHAPAAATARDAASVEEARQRIRGLVDLLPPREVMREGLQRLVERGVRMLHVYAGGDHHYYSYRTQFSDAFPGLDFGGLLELEHLPDADHYFSRPDHQEWLDERTARWLDALRVGTD